MPGRAVQRDVQVYVDAASWGTKPVPANFSSGIEVFDIPEVLLTIGIVTSPPRAAGFSLSEYWAWLRYICAISTQPGLALVPEYRDLDSHQKTILSDDFGMGFSVHWIWKRMNFSFICDGRYFVDRFLLHFGGAATSRTPGKRGPSKCPDFVCWTPAGRFHVVECKGTQSGSFYRDKQIATAKLQKTTINFPAARQGEELACGVTVTFEEENVASQLFVTDPERRPVLTVNDQQVAFAEDTLARGLASRLLGLSGLPATALALAEPDIGEIAMRRRRRASTKTEDLRQIDFIRRKRAEEELQRERPHVAFEAEGIQYSGREREFELPIPVDTGERTVRTVIVRQGINRQVLEDLGPEKFSQPLDTDGLAGIRKTISEARSGSDAKVSFVAIGKFYYAELELRE